MEYLCEKRSIFGLLGSSEGHLVWTWKTGNGTTMKMLENKSWETVCSVELVNLAVALIAIIASSLVVLTYKCSNNHKVGSGLLPLHTTRSIMCLSLLLVLLLELSESLIVARPLLPVLSLAAVIGCWIAHRETEVRNGLGVAVTGGVFTVLAVARTWRLLHLYKFGLTMKHARLISNAGASACSGLLAIIDSYTLYTMIQRTRRFRGRPAQNGNISYKHGTAPFLSKATFHWVVELLIRGYRAPLNIQDLGELPKEESTRVQFGKISKIYQDEKKRRGIEKISLWRCYWRSVWPAFTAGGVLKLLGDATTLVGPMAIPKIINYVAFTQNMTSPPYRIEAEGFVTIFHLMENGYFLGLLVFLAAILQSTLSQASTHILNIEGIHLRTAIQALVYDRALRLCSWSIVEDEIPPDREEENQRHDTKHPQTIDIGTLTNLMAEDAYNVMSFFWIGHYTWAAPLKIFAIIFLLYLKLGISAIVGALCCILIVTPMQLLLGKRMSANSEAMSEKSDARLLLVNEILQGMRLVKLRAWEPLFQDKMRQTRNLELELLDRDSLYWALITFLTHASSVLMTLFTFGVYFWVEECHLDAGNVFASLALFSQLTVPLFIFPLIVPIIINAQVSTTRLQDFLLLSETNNILPDDEDQKTGGMEANESKTKFMGDTDAEATKMNEENAFRALDNIEECEEDHQLNLDLSSSSDTVFENESDIQPVVAKVSGVFSWGSKGNQLIINELTFPRGRLTLIVGRMGSGKTSLLSAMLGEIHTVRGKVEWAKGTKVAYVAQKPWLLNATIRDNILFGSEYLPRRYGIVLRACALQPDMGMLPARDLTRIGEKGINLSGGQKQRIAIARAIYSDADTIILDDPLSALDQQVGHQVFDHGIQRLLLRRGRTVIMVTHRHELMSAAEQIVAMEGCRLRVVGSRSDIEKSDPELVAEWKEAARRRLDDQRRAQKSARDRWSLLKIVSRIGSSLKKRHASDSSSSTDQDVHVSQSTFVPLRKLRSTLSESRYLAHDLTDLPVPTEEWGVVRRRSRKHRNAVRAISLQPPTDHPPPVLRQHSTPTILESDYLPPARKRNNTMDNGQQNNIVKQLFSSGTTSTQEWDHYPVKRLLSTDSECTDEMDYDDDRNAAFDGNEDPEDDGDIGGLVTAGVWANYLKAGGIVPGLTYIGAALACQALRVYTDLWLSRWTDQGSDPNVSSDPHKETIFYFRVYIALSVGSIILAAVYNAAGQWAGSRARRRLHQEAIASLLKSPLSYFERTPIGRILNRFSADMGVIDKKLSMSVQRLTAFVLLCGSAMLVNIIIAPWFLAAALPTTTAYFLLQRFYRRSARELQRLEGSTRGPPSAHFSETLAGLPTLRASKQQTRFMEIMVEHLDANTNAFLVLNTSTRWLGIALDYLGAVIVVAAIFAALVSAELYPGRITPALVGLAVNYTLLVPIYLNWVVKFISEIEMYMGSVARLCTKTPQEDYQENGLQVSKDWPQKGEIIFENVSLRYNPQGESVVTNLNLHVPSGEKLGICGRTGSGKSSTANALFQLIEVHHGRILIDGVDIRQLPLHTLRSRLSTIPQDVILFSGTVRENLDPLAEHTDDELWAALELAQMKEFIESHPGGLDMEVREGGENFSAGQRQLLSMGRSVLRKTAVVVLDEATGALDATTERSLLHAAAIAFKDRTVVTIAHRVASLMDCDRVVVFDAGRIVEDGAPRELLRQPMGFFSAMMRVSEDVSGNH